MHFGKKAGSNWLFKLTNRPDRNLREGGLNSDIGSLLSKPNRAILSTQHKSIACKVTISHIFGILTAEGPIVNNDTQQRAWVKTWARRIKALGLSSVALSLLEIAHAFGFLGSQALLITQPLAAGIVNDSTLEQTLALLDSPELQEQLKLYLEEEDSQI